MSYSLYKFEERYRNEQKRHSEVSHTVTFALKYPDANNDTFLLIFWIPDLWEVREYDHIQLRSIRMHQHTNKHTEAHAHIHIMFISYLLIAEEVSKDTQITITLFRHKTLFLFIEYNWLLSVYGSINIFYTSLSPMLKTLPREYELSLIHVDQ